MSNILDQLAKMKPVHREIYGTDRNNKPNAHCNWERLPPTISSGFGWVENDAHFRERLSRNKMV